MHYKRLKEKILMDLKIGLSPKLLYHSYNHIVDVYKSAIRIARNEGVGVRDQMILYTSIFLHDAGFLKSLHKDHEEASCEMARQILPQFAYESEDIEQICGLIMSTKIPQSPRSKLGEIICDADLDYLGRDDFKIYSDNLFKELQYYGLVDTIENWNRIQVDFLKSHSYFTKTSKVTRSAKKLERLSELEKIVSNYE